MNSTLTKSTISTIFMDVKMVVSFGIEHDINVDGNYFSEMIHSRVGRLDGRIEKLINDSGLRMDDFTFGKVSVLGEDEW